jgi:hypothetical protein
VPHVRCGSVWRRKRLGPSAWRCSALLVLFVPSLAAAAALRYEAPSECPPAAALREEVERLLGSALVDAGAIEVRVQISRAAADNWRVVLSVPDERHDEPRTRVISGHSCADVAESAAIAAAIAIRAGDPELERADRANRVDPSVPEERASTTAPAESRPAPAPPAPPTRPQTRFGLGTSLLLDTRTLPSLAVGLEAAAFADFLGPGLRAMVFGGLLGSQEVHLSSGHGAKFDLLYAGLGGCGVKSFGSWSGLLCAGMEAGSLRGEGLVSAPRVGNSTWLAPRVDVGLSVPLLLGFSVTARGGAAFPLLRETFVVDGDQVIHRPGGPTARVSAGLELTL